MLLDMKWVYSNSTFGITKINNGLTVVLHGNKTWIFGKETKLVHTDLMREAYGTPYQ